MESFDIDCTQQSERVKIEIEAEVDHVNKNLLVYPFIKLKIPLRLEMIVVFDQRDERAAREYVLLHLLKYIKRELADLKVLDFVDFVNG